MKQSKNKEILEELQSVLKGSTLDAVFSPLLFALLNAWFSLSIAFFGALSLASGTTLIRVLNKQKGVYAIGGVIGVAIAGGFALLANNATNFFLPGIISNLFLLLVMLVSLMIGKPLAALASHLTRGWTLSWFWRKDIKPAYTEVTLMWLILFVLRSGLQIYLFLQNSVVELVWINTLLGFPFTVGVLVLSYVYGLFRLKQLKGPGIEEYNEHQQPPYKGQTRGF